ncbi:hypothetical protein QWT87_03775 [Chryseobacterium sp. APV1]|uniref:Uncharacterized protein n=1 Tax=Chryseobacterium urinae TaxID=3058400 RepID=A0ABT8U0K2_9FLAO|nr:hypothetical protein [Chryseobacterium sp. APV1]MDO3423997.1 hypothetical protein [Chryseobacterium sp. APV1]
MYKNLEYYSIGHADEIDYHEFNKRILRTIENLSIIQTATNGYLYEIDQKTKRGITVTYYPKKIQISIPPLSSKYDYKLADVLVNYLVFYTDGVFFNSLSKKEPPYDDRMKNDNKGYFIFPKVFESKINV